jgi:uncharacterized protein DUF4352
MKKISTVVASLLALTLAGCTTSEVTSNPDGKTSGPAKSTATSAKIGDTISLKGNERGLKVAVTVVRFSPSARGKDEFNQPEKGQRFVAVQITMKNVGSIAYDDSPGNGAKLIDADDQQYDETMQDVAAGPSIGSAVKLGPGSTRKGYLVFSVPKKTKLAKFQFTLDSGMAPQAGEWLLK